MPWNRDRVTTPEVKIALIAAFLPETSATLCRNRPLRRGSLPRIVLRPDGSVVTAGTNKAAADDSKPVVFDLVRGDDTALACTDNMVMDVMEGAFAVDVLQFLLLSRSRSCSCSCL
jgi:hypothetical protein